MMISGAVYDSVPLPQFDVLARQLVHRPATTSVTKAWGKLDQLERRLDAFDWACMVVRDPRRCDTFVSDLAFAFILGFESTWQVLSREAGKREAWLDDQAAYDMPCRGLRTLRNLEAHIQAGQIQPGVSACIRAL